jgi:hypothetical protein
VLDVLETVSAEVPERDTLGEVVLHHRTCRIGDQDLPAVARPRDPGRPVNIDPKVVVAPEHPLTRVQAHANPYGTGVGPLALFEGALGGHRRAKGPHRAPECGEERISFGPNHVPVLRVDGRPHDLVVPVLDLAIALTKLLKKTRRSLDVGEHERDGSGWGLDHCGSLLR